MTPNCHICGERMDDKGYADVTFHGLESLRLNGVTFRVHARCLRFSPTASRDITLPERLSDPVAESAA